MDEQKDDAATLPDIDLPDIGTEGEGLPDIGLPDIGDGADMSADTPEIDSELPDLGGELPDLGADLPDLDVDTPDIDAGDALSELPDLDSPPMEELDADKSDVDLSALRTPVTAETINRGAESNPVKQEVASLQSAMSGGGDSAIAFKKIQGIKVRVQVMLGETRLSVSQLTNLKKGEFIQLDTKIGEPVNILANGSLIARGEIAVEDDDAPRFGITLTEIIDSSVLSN